MNPVALILIMTSGGLWAYDMYGAYKLGKQSTIKLLNVDSLKVIGSEFEISSSVAIDNPTSKAIAIKKPYLRLFSNEKEIGNSVPSSDQVVIRANARTVISKVNVRVSFTAIPSLALALFNNKNTDQKLSLEVDTIINGIALSDKTEFSLNDLIKKLIK